MSWGRYPVSDQKAVSSYWHQDIDLSQFEQSMLPFGNGRSYGDSCLNHDGALFDCRPLNRYINFDESTGVLTCEAGVTLEQILLDFVPRGYFLPVTPGTKYITVGGAIANDVHGKNHHVSGTFGCHVQEFELLRSTGERLLCSPTRNSDLFQATIGGLGLTGIITWASFKLISISSSYIQQKSIKFGHVDEFFDLVPKYDSDFDYTVAWLDTQQKGRALGRGLLMLGNFADGNEVSGDTLAVHGKKKVTIPFAFPGFALNSLSVSAFNFLYYNKQLSKETDGLVHYDPFFYPLDSVSQWNLIYGRRGFVQYQFVAPPAVSKDVVRLILLKVAKEGKASFLSVLKLFGSVNSPGLLSFPDEGATLALDFPFEGKKTLDMLSYLDDLIAESGGRVYPAKDARMSAAHFQKFFPNWEKLESLRDPKFNSEFWQRVVQQGEPQ